MASVKNQGDSKALRGNERIQQLMEQFPEMPRQMVVKADAIKEGTKPTPALYDIGRWATPDVYDHFVYGYEHNKEEAGAGHTPMVMYFRDGMALKVMLNSASPYEVKYEGRGSYRLYRDDDPIEEVVFAPRPQWYWKKTSNGTPMNQVLALPLDRWLSLYNTTYCEYFRDGNQCRYCNLNSTGEHYDELGEDRLPVKREQDIYETYMAAAQETGVEGMAMSGGGFHNRKKEADLYIRNIQVLKRAMQDSGCVVPMGAGCQAMEEEDYIRLKEAGFTFAANPMEVWDAKLFPIVCPGKAKYVGREHWIECTLKGVEVLGWGRVSVNFVLGVELVPPFGFKTEEEAAASVLEGFQFWASHGGVPTTIPFRSVPGAVLAQAQRARTEYVLRMEQERHKLVKEYDLAPPRAGGAGRRRGFSAGFSIAGDWTD